MVKGTSRPASENNVRQKLTVVKRLSVTSLCWLVFFATCAHADTVSLWGRWERSFGATKGTGSETEVAVALTSPTGRKLTVAGFWDGDNTWKVRFMPDELGEWHYRSSSNPLVDGLNGKYGEFTCQHDSDTTRFFQHGAVQIAPGERFFQHADGTPFFWLGDTVWYGAILSAKPDWDAYLADRANKRFSVIHFNVIAPRNGVAADEHGEVSFSGAQSLESTSRFSRLATKVLKLIGLYRVSPLRMNPRFYQRLDKRIDAVNSHGVLAAIVLTWGLRPQDSGNALPEGEVVRLVRYLTSRYGDHHVVWVLTGDNAYEGESGERWKRIGRSAFANGHHAPVTTHPIGMSWPWQHFKDEKWMDFIVYQSGHGNDANDLRWIYSGPPHQYWQDWPPRPFINLEPPYEGHLGYQSRKPHTDYDTRRAIYWSLLNAPTAGVTYGAHGVWSWHTAVGQPPTDHPDTGIAKTWREALSFPGSTQMKHLADLFTSIAWWTLRPDDNLVAENPGKDDAAQHVSAARSQDGELAVIYLPVGSKLRLRPGILKEGLKAEWFDPRTGRKIPAGTSERSSFEAPDQKDWILVLNN